MKRLRDNLSFEKIEELMDYAIKLILESDMDIIITYPNNDEGSDTIHNIIQYWKNHQH